MLILPAFFYNKLGFQVVFSLSVAQNGYIGICCRESLVCHLLDVETNYTTCLLKDNQTTSVTKEPWVNIFLMFLNPAQKMPE
jgi:hypothetical protein